MTSVISVDAMGGDNGLTVTIPACIRFLNEFADASLVLSGDEESIKKALDTDLERFESRIRVVHATQIVEMDEQPQIAMRKRASSMRLAINEVKDGSAHAVVSAGNTGALMATARYVLRTLDGIDRPAIAKMMPTVSGEVCVLDLGANVECDPVHLLQFGVMGSQLMKAVSGKQNPVVGILNIGSEEIKGNETVKKAAELLRKTDLNFCGNVEGNDIFKGIVDVVVTDGFTGNVALKTTEGVAKMIGSFLKEEFSRNIITKLIAVLSFPVLKRLKNRVDPSKYNGAILLGLNGLVVKSHGGTDVDGFYYALLQAYHESQANVIKVMQEYLANNKNIFDQSIDLTEFKDLQSL